MTKLLVSLTALALAAPLAAQAQTGQWIVATDRWGNKEYSTLNLVADGKTLTGDWDGDPLTGAVRARRLTFAVTDGRGSVYRFEGAIGRDGIRGTADFPDGNNPSARVRHGFTARRVPDRPAGGPRVHDFRPTDYSNSFSPDRAPVLTIWPGDTVRTVTIDSGGVDAQGVTRALFGNPQTGPFFIAGAAPGDSVIVHIERLRLNRDWADSLDTIVGRALGAELVAEAKGLGKPVRWRIDRAAGIATPENAGAALKGLRVPVRPMLGGLALASGFGSPPLSTGDTGRAGGNMDFPEVIEGNRVWLPVLQPGGLLYLGDGHARQGDGETSQYALETSMDVTFRVELVKRKSVPMPRVESPTELMVLGQAGSLDDALKQASTGLIQWLREDYGLSLAEAAQVMGSAVRFTVPNLAGRSVGVAARIDRALLPAR
ncbi:acetamidase/formamidase [Sphingomonas naasensis]|uniref:acetamidase/formamidase family protein n=1 Tax=Sphingomonas naasensis TaxID=1344951 RepID=UPI001F110269|nr:acetamidase/formamidase family protein [Sphingomonas naasensis]NIJ19151.1 acetamidase/formamidase [Sphingomonas naasensis]